MLNVVMSTYRRSSNSAWGRGRISSQEDRLGVWKGTTRPSALSMGKMVRLENGIKGHTCLAKNLDFYPETMENFFWRGVGGGGKRDFL